MGVPYRRAMGALFLIAPLAALAQVQNDSIANRLELPLNKPIRSSTSHSTVEWDCVDEKLTGKCIQYHNDQWFYFTAADIAAHYLTISSQNCRDIKGVQLVLIKGEPCQPETYQVLACVSLASQEDVYLKAEDLEAGTTYLLNVDGYLHDFCSFTISYTNTPGGLPVNQPLERKSGPELQQQEGEIQLSWETPASIRDQTLHYELHRREAVEKKYSQRQLIPHQRNAYGMSQAHYTAIDSLPKAGTYFYTLLARLENGEGLVLAREEVKLEERDEKVQALEINLPFGYKTPYTVLLFDAGNQQLLDRKTGVVARKQQSLSLPVARWQKQGTRLFRVVLINDKKGEQKEWLFSR